jgi:hypothetical protein
MKNRRMLLPTLFSIALVFSLIVPAPLLNTASVMAHGPVTPMVAAGSIHTVGLKADGTMVAVGHNSSGQCNVDGWNLALSLPPSQKVQVGIKAGDWIKVEYTNTAWPSGAPYPEWLRFEFLSVEGTNATTRVTRHMSDGTEQSDTVPVDLATGSGEAFGLSGFVIPSNLTIGDSFYMTGYGDMVIEGETTETYAGAKRTVVYASYSQLTPAYEFLFDYYWDKLTGVIMEASITFFKDTATVKVLETNMWEATTIWKQWWFWVLIAAAIVALALAMYRLRKRKTPATPTPPAEGT